jgi:hypothetical protein
MPKHNCSSHIGPIKTASLTVSGGIDELEGTRELLVDIEHRDLVAELLAVVWCGEDREDYVTGELESGVDDLVFPAEEVESVLLEEFSDNILAVCE